MQHITAEAYYIALIYGNIIDRPIHYLWMEASTAVVWVISGSTTLMDGLIEFSHKLISTIQPVVTQVLRSPKENRANKYSTYHDEEHAETKYAATKTRRWVRIVSD